MQLGPNQEHMRRGSSQSIHSDIGNQSLPTGPGGRGGYSQGGRGGRGSSYYQTQMAYSPHQTFRPAQNGRGMNANYQNQGRHQQVPYQGSPNLGTRSPMMNNANPGTPQMAQMHMMPGMQGQPGYYMGPQVKPPYPISHDRPRDPALDPARGKQSARSRGRGNRGRGRGTGRGDYEAGQFNNRVTAPKHYVSSSLPPILPPDFLLPDLSPESGNFEHFLTQNKQGYGPPTAADPSISYMSNMNMNYMQQYQQMPNQYGQYGAPPQSPRPPYQQPGYGAQMQPSYSQGPPSMSRQSSQMSATADRPGSSIGQAPHTPSVAASHAGSRAPSMSTPKPEFSKPKKSSAIVIKNAAGEIVNFKKPASSTTPAPVNATPATPTPPSRTGSAADHTRAESSAKSDEEKKKAMQEAVARKVAEENAKLKQEKDAAEQKAQMDLEAAQAAEREAERKKAEAEALEKEAEEAAARKAAADAEAAAAAAEADAKAKADAEAEAETKKAAESTKETAPEEDEPDYDAIEAEMAAIEAEEARIEEEYQKKKAAQKEAQRKKEEEEFAAYEATMKEAEAKAEEEEIAREKKRAEGISQDPESKRLFASLKLGEGATPISTAEETPVETPGESGAQTPVSDGSMAPPKNAASSRKKIADLTLDIKKSTEPAEPSATLKSLTTADRLQDITKVSYPEGIDAPTSSLNAAAPADGKFKYNKEFLLQFQDVFKEKPTLDWDTKIREALGEGDSSARPGTARTPSSMGGRNPSNRPSAGNFQQMGQFGGAASSRAPVPAGTTSEQRFAASQAAMRGGPVNPFNMGRGSMGPPMGGRTPSNNPFGAIAAGSPRPGGQSQRGGRNESKRNRGNHKQEVEANKSMPLTAGMSIALPEVTPTGWKPRSIGQNPSGPTPSGDGYLEADVVQRKVKAALNKMTPEKFDKIADQILDIAAQSKSESDGRTLRQVIQLTFEKATDEAHWAPMYAMFCGKMLRTMSPDIKDENIKDKNGEIVTGGNLFRKYLLNRCQEEFERGWKVNLPAPKEGESQEAAMLSDEYYIAAAAKRRGLGLVKFIGELFKLGMLTERIMHECVKKLVDYEGMPEEAEVESLTSLLRTIGKQLDDPQSKAQGRMDVYFARIQQTMDMPDLPSRLRFMLLDIVDLRKNGWHSKQDDKGPKTIQEIREEAEIAAQKAEMQRLAQQANRGGGGGRMPMGRGDARSFSGYGQAPPPDTSNRVGADDLRRLGGRNSRNPSSTGPSLGPPSLLGGGRTNSRRGLGPGSSLLSRGEESNASSRTGTPPAQKDKKDESSTNAFR